MLIVHLFRKKRFVMVILASLILSGCQDNGPAPGGQARAAAADYNIVPLPAEISVADGVFVLSADTPLVMDALLPEVENAARYFAETLRRTTGISPPIYSEQSDSDKPAIRFRLSETSGSIEKGSYEIAVSPDGIEVLAPTGAGLFYGAVTLWQMATSSTQHSGIRSLPAGHIRDYPQFEWRGLMLDSARHFQSPDYIKKFIDWMALHKLNIFHWHLTDDQGWRLEIKKYPRLTEIGAWRVPAGAASKDIDPETGTPRKYGGFYSQEDVREIVQYATARHITIVPEIEMPGHALSAIAAYPELSSIDNPPDHVIADWGVFPYLYNVNDATFSFLEDVLDEVIALFPGQYIHIGGDEAVKDQWQASEAVQARMQVLGIEDEKKLQSYFIERIEKYVNARGRSIIGWDEILEGGLAPNAAVMSWRGIEGAVEAANKGHDAVLSPAPILYLDNMQNRIRHGLPGRGNLVSLQDVYGFNPYPEELSEAQRKHILGLQANAWTEHMRTEDRVTYMTYPRAAAVAELGWSPAERHDWLSFVKRMPAQFARYRSLELGYSPALFTVQYNMASGTSADNVTVELYSQANQGDIHYAMDGSDPTANSSLYTAPLTLNMPVIIRTASFVEGIRVSPVTERRFDDLSNRYRTNHELNLCTKDIVLSLEDDAPIKGPRASFYMDIMNPCWVYEGVDLSTISAIELSVGQVPFNFQIGDAINSITFRPPETAAGEMNVYLDSCEDGVLLGSIPLAPALKSDGVSKLPAIQLPAIGGTHDLCFTYTAQTVDPLWAIESVQLVPKVHNIDRDEKTGASFDPR